MAEFGRLNLYAIFGILSMSQGLELGVDSPNLGGVTTYLYYCLNLFKNLFVISLCWSCSLNVLFFCPIFLDFVDATAMEKGIQEHVEKQSL